MSDRDSTNRAKYEINKVIRDQNCYVPRKFTSPLKHHRIIIALRSKLYDVPEMVNKELHFCEVANRILPALCSLTVDPEKSVRDPAFKTIKGFLGKLEKVSEDPSLRETMEADVHTATPSIGNAAATWAGWAVTAVTAKFYRSQSDTARPRPPLTGRNLSKPASLEQPSSSSLSTTTSSVTSMTSLEHESNDTSASASDYGADNWDNENWGEMDTSQDPSSPIAGTSNNGQLSTQDALNDIRDGWDNDDWGSLEEEPNEEQENPEDTRPSELPNINTNCNNVSPVSESHTNNSNANWNSDSWADGEFEPIEEPLTGNPKLDEARRKREEKKVQRQRELEARRAQRGPMKLGAKKL